jgi:Fe-S cluster assembly protein SufD
MTSRREPRETIDRWLAHFRSLEAAGLAGDWLAPVRRAAIDSFASRGFPTTKDEDWKYTNVEPVVRVPWTPVFASTPNGVPARAVERLGLGLAGTRLVFVNGHLGRALSSVVPRPGANVGSLAEAMLRDERALVAAHLARHARPDRTAFAALNAAFTLDGALVHVPDGSEYEDPIQLLFLSSSREADTVSHPRVLVALGRSSRATLVETYGATGPGASLTNTVVEIVLGDGAALDHVKLVEGGRAAAHVALTEVVQGRDSRYRSWSLALGASFARNDLCVLLDGEGAACTLDGLYLASDEELVDNHTRIDHAKPRGTSRELYKGILDGRSRAVFNGKVIVRPGAQQTDAQQTNKNLLLSERAEVDTKPELQIRADDVKCSHGAAIGQLDPEAVFYCKSRGMDETTARRTLTWGFASDVIRRIPMAPLRDAIDARLAERLAPEHGGTR